MLAPNVSDLVVAWTVLPCAEVKGPCFSVVIVSTVDVCCVEVGTSVVDISGVLVNKVVVSCGVTVDVSGAGVGMMKFSGTNTTKNCSDGWFAPSIEMLSGKVQGLPFRITCPASTKKVNLRGAKHELFIS